MSKKNLKKLKKERKYMKIETLIASPLYLLIYCFMFSAINRFETVKYNINELLYGLLFCFLLEIVILIPTYYLISLIKFKKGETKIIINGILDFIIYPFLIIFIVL